MVRRAHRQGLGLFAAGVAVMGLLSIVTGAPQKAPPTAARRTVSSPLWQLLSGNRGHAQAIDLGLTYTYAQPPNNPGDEGRRLLDNDAPADDWNNVVGFNFVDATLEMRWPKPQWLGRVRLRMAHPQHKPRKVEVLGRSDASKPWTPLGEIVPSQGESGSGWYELTLPQTKLVREVRLDLRLKEWGFFLHEVQLWGVPGYVGRGPVTAERRGGKALLAQKGVPRATIVVAEGAPEKVRAAAFLLQSALHRMTGAGLPVATDADKPTGTLLLVGPSKLTDAMGVQVKQGAYPARERSVVKGQSTKFALVGNDAGTYEGTRRAVYLFLESLGAGWFAPHLRWTVLPKSAAPEVGPRDIDFTPAFNSRDIGWTWPRSDFDPTAWGLGGSGVFHVHIYSAIVPKDEKTFREHPEWFAMVGGKRQKSQLSFTHPEVVNRAAQMARDFFAQRPGFASFSLSADDAGGFDESPEAQALDVNAGGRTLAFANAVARKLRLTHPDKKLVFYAYWFTKPAPTRVRAEPGVNVMVINDTCQAHALDDLGCPANHEWKANFAAWKRTGAELSAYDWYVPAANDPRWAAIPLVPGDVALRDLRFYHRQGVRWMFYESGNGERGETFPLRWPLYYTVARGMEKPSLTFKGIMDPACRKLFGPAGSAMSAFYQELARALEASPTHGGNWHLPNARGLYPPPVQAKLRRLLAQAAAQAKTKTKGVDPAIAARVADVRAAWTRAEKAIATFADPGSG